MCLLFDIACIMFQQIHFTLVSISRNIYQSVVHIPTCWCDDQVVSLGVRSASLVSGPVNGMQQAIYQASARRVQL